MVSLDSNEYEVLFHIGYNFNYWIFFAMGHIILVHRMENIQNIWRKSITNNSYTTHATHTTHATLLQSCYQSLSNNEWNFDQKNFVFQESSHLISSIYSSSPVYTPVLQWHCRYFPEFASPPVWGRTHRTQNNNNRQYVPVSHHFKIWLT